jgi:hypothetical protein
MHLSTSIAGMAPYCSCAGIFVSSIATIVKVPGADPRYSYVFL